MPCPRLVQRIAALGHEIAPHGFSHQLIYQQSPDQFREETIRANHSLEDLVAADVLGYRAASCSITRESRWALDILIDLGFKYDSSVSRYTTIGMACRTLRQLLDPLQPLEPPLLLEPLPPFEAPLAPDVPACVVETLCVAAPPHPDE